MVSLDYHTTADNSQPVRIVASLNDWTIDRDGQVRFEKANTLPNSASSWLIHSPAETLVVVPASPDLAESWKRGLSMRPELQQLKLNIEAQNIEE